MFKLYMAAALALFTTAAQAQTDTTAKPVTDTLKVGKFVIIKTDERGKSEGRRSDSDTGHKKFSVTIGRSKRNNNKNVDINWFIFDLGFAGLRNETNFPGAFASRPAYYPTPGSAKPLTENAFDLRQAKSSNVNIWIFMQKVNITKHKLNLKYGLGYEMYNFRYDSRISYRDEPRNFIFEDTVSFSKNKLFAGYATVPLMLNFQANPNKPRSFSASVGVSAGYLIGSRVKQVSDERGKEKYRDNFDLEPFRLAAIGELGLGPVRLYGSYSLNTLHKTSTTGLSQYPFVVGIRFSNW